MTDSPHPTAPTATVARARQGLLIATGIAAALSGILVLAVWFWPEEENCDPEQIFGCPINIELMFITIGLVPIVVALAVCLLIWWAALPVASRLQGPARATLIAVGLALSVGAIVLLTVRVLVGSVGF